MAETRGIRNNNPFNIKRSSSRWKGKVPFKDSTDNTFEQFISPDYGLRAGIILLRNYVNQGYDTYRKVINRFAPSSENDVNKYLDFVCCYGLYDPDCVFQFKSMHFYHLVKQICYFESRFVLRYDEYYTILQKFNL